MRSPRSRTATAASWCRAGCRRYGMPNSVRDALAGLALAGRGRGGDHRPRAGGNPGCRRPRRYMAGPALSCSSMLSGRPENPVNAVAPNATRTLPVALHRRQRPGHSSSRPCAAHLDAAGFPEVTIEQGRHPHAGQPHRSDGPLGAAAWPPAWRGPWAGRPQLIPNSGGGLPGDVFIDHLGVPLVWIPHSYNGCKQHGPDEHLLIAPAREVSPRSRGCGGTSASPARCRWRRRGNPASVRAK